MAEVLADIADIAFVEFDGHDVVRHKLVQRIVNAYKEHGEREEARRDAGAGEPAARREVTGEGGVA